MKMTFKNITELNTYINTHSVNLENIDIDNYTINSNESNNFITFRNTPRNYTLFISLEENSYHKISEDKSHIIEMYIPQIFTVKVTATISEIIDIRDNYDVKYLEFIDLNEKMSLPDTIIYSGDNYEVETEYADIMNWGAKIANLHHAWSRGFTGKGVKVGLIDGNFVDKDKDPNIPIKEKIDFVTKTEEFPMHHGTLSASSICSPLNGINNVGTAPECDLYALNMNFTYPPIIEALNWCLVNKMDVLVLNYGSNSLPYYTEANLITAINNMGTIIVVPSHNFPQ
jgi:subtilisin family serine protease